MLRQKLKPTLTTRGTSNSSTSSESGLLRSMLRSNGFARRTLSLTMGLRRTRSYSMTLGRTASARQRRSTTRLSISSISSTVMIGRCGKRSDRWTKISLMLRCSCRSMRIGSWRQSRSKVVRTCARLGMSSVNTRGWSVRLTDCSIENE